MLKCVIQCNQTIFAARSCWVSLFQRHAFCQSHVPEQFLHPSLPFKNRLQHQHFDDPTWTFRHLQHQIRSQEHPARRQQRLQSSSKTDVMMTHNNNVGAGEANGICAFAQQIILEPGETATWSPRRITSSFVRVTVQARGALHVHHNLWERSAQARATAVMRRHGLPSTFITFAPDDVSRVSPALSSSVAMTRRHSPALTLMTAALGDAHASGWLTRFPSLMHPSSPSLTFSSVKWLSTDLQAMDALPNHQLPKQPR